MAAETMSKPWEPSSVLHVQGKDPRFNYRWISKDNVDKRLAEGWEIVKGTTPDSAKGKSLTLADGRSVDSVTSVRNLILARMPKEKAEARNKYYEKMSQDSIDAVDGKFRTDTAGQSYGKVKVEKGE